MQERIIPDCECLQKSTTCMRQNQVTGATNRHTTGFSRDRPAFTKGVLWKWLDRLGSRGWSPSLGQGKP